MGLFAIFQEVMPGFMERVGEPAVFTPAVGDPIDCHVGITFNVLLQPNGVEAQAWQRGTVIEVVLSVIGREPNRGETFTLDIPADDTIYTVQAILENDGLSVKMAVTT